MDHFVVHVSHYLIWIVAIKSVTIAIGEIVIHVKIAVVARLRLILAVDEHLFDEKASLINV